MGVVYQTARRQNINIQSSVTFKKEAFINVKKLRIIGNNG
jgi:hypothetical protein